MTEAAITVRTAVLEDVPLILTFIRKKAEFDGGPDAVQATVEGLQQTLFGEPPLAFIAFGEIAGRVVGFASYYFTFLSFLARPGIWLDDLYVDPDMRSQGVGRRFLAHLACLARKKGCGRIEWTAAASNERGLAFYRRNGASVRETVRLCRLDNDAIEQLASGG